MTKVSKYIFIMIFCFLIQVFSQPVNACVEGLKWGMDLSNVETHLGVSLIPLESKKSESVRSERYSNKWFTCRGS